MIDDLVELLGTRSRPDLLWISRVSNRTEAEADRAVRAVVAHERAIREMSRAIAKTGRSYYAQFPAPIDLYALVRIAKPNHIVESGVASGVSSTFLLLGLESNGSGTLHSMDLPTIRQKPRGGESWAIPPGLSSGWAIPRVLKRRWDLRLGRSEDLLAPLLGEIGSLDFYCHDSPVDEAHLERELRSLRVHLSPGSVVVADNTDPIFDEFAREMGATAFHRRRSSLAAFRVPGA